jgi:hypothetical protein
MYEGDTKSPAQKKKFTSILGGAKKSFTSPTYNLSPSSTSLKVSKTSVTDLAKQQEDTRSTISLIFIIAYFIVIAGLVLFTTFFKLEAETAKDYLLAIGSPLGFIIGYYFKSGGKD